MSLFAWQSNKAILFSFTKTLFLRFSLALAPREAEFLASIASFLEQILYVHFLVRQKESAVFLYRCKSWTVEKAEHHTIDAFKLWCWSRLFRVPCTAVRSNKSILKEIDTEFSLEGLMLKLKLQYFGHEMCRANSLEKTLMLGKIEGRRRGG